VKNKYLKLIYLQGDRFGGALDNAAKQFSEAFDSGLHPADFVNKMRKEGKLIMGVGHRIKSVGEFFSNQTYSIYSIYLDQQSRYACYSS
jgi:hypothetical protein